MKYKLVIFDWDGTLVDSLGTILTCNKVVARLYNQQAPTEEMVRNAIGNQFDRALRICFPKVEEHLLPQMTESYHKLMRDPEFHSELFPETKQMLAACREAGLHMAVVTSKNRHEFNEESKSVGLEDYFDLVLCDGEHGNKPEPQKMLYTLDHFAAKPAEAVMVGDTTIDILFAKNGGVMSIAVAFGAHTIEQLATENPDLIIQNWGDLLDHLRGA
jgi:phosphoglycolate phosphatase